MKKLFLITAVLIAAAMAFTGCTKKKDEGSSEGGVDSISIEKYVTLGEYKGLPVKINDTTVTDEEVEEAEKEALSSRAEKQEVTDRPVENGDTVNIDYEGKKDGVAFQGGTAQGYDLVIGSGTFIPGFEDGLIGAEIGETRDLNLTFPENYGTADLAGQDVIFTVTVNSISGEVYPELTDDLAHELNSNASTAEEFRALLKEELQKQKSDSAKAQAYGELLTAAQENATISSGADLPAWLIEENKKAQKSSFEKSLAMYGMTLESYLSQQGMTEKDFEDTLESYAQTIAGQQLLITALAKAENVTISDEDVEKQYEEDAAIYGYDSAEEFKESVKEQGEEATFREATLTRKVEEMLFSYAKVENPEMVTW